MLIIFIKYRINNNIKLNYQIRLRLKDNQFILLIKDIRHEFIEKWKYRPKKRTKHLDIRYISKLKLLSKISNL